MGRYILGRIGYMLITLLIIASLSFVLMQTLPGSPFNDEKLSAEQKARLYEKYGLDKPVPVQFFVYMKNLAQGDLGVSFQYDGRAVNTIIGERIGASAVLGAQAILVGTSVGLI